MQIEILSTKQTTNPGKKLGTTYKALEVAYKNLTFQGKVEGRKIMSFGATASTFSVLAEATPGDVFEVDAKKNEGTGFIEWLSAKKSEEAVVVSIGKAVPSIGTPGSLVNKSTYETPEERAKKQVYIVRQSSIGSAIETLSVGAKNPPKADDVIELAAVYEDFVFHGTKKSIVDSFDDLEVEIN